MKRIVVATAGLGGGGAERVALLLANYLVNKGHAVRVISVDNRMGYFVDPKIDCIIMKSTSKNPYIKNIKKMFEFRKLVKEFSADVLVSFVINEALLTCNDKKLYKVFTLRNDPYRNLSSRLFVEIRNFVFKKANKVVFQTEDAKKYFEKSIQDKGVVIFNPITDGLPYWKEEAYSGKRIITACRLEPQKNLKMMIDGFDVFRKNYPEYTLEIYGEGSQKEEIENYIKDNAIKNVTLMGYTKSIHEIMATSSMFVMSSDYEGISNSMLEALAIGIPTICTDCPIGGAKTFIESYANGILVPVNDRMALNKALLEIARDKEFAVNLSQKSVLIREELSQDRILDKWCSLFE